MDRRDFIKLTAVTGTTTALASCGSPENQLIRFVPDDDITPGIAEWKPSICPVCSAGCGVNVRVMDADVETIKNGQPGVVKMMVAKKLEGLATDKISRGGLCARGQAAIQITYHPDRLTQPMKRSGARGSGEFKPITWDEAIAELVGKLDALAAAGDQKSLAYLSRPRRSRRLEVAAEFATAFGGAAPMTFELFGDRVLRHANGVSFGHEQLPTHDLARSRFVISFGADFVGTWNSVVAQNAAYGEMRQGRPGIRGKLVQIESRMTTTGACADEWVAVRSGTEGVLALGLAQLIGGSVRLKPDATAYTTEEVEKITGVPAKRIERIAKEMASQKPAVAIVGGPALAHTNATFTALAVNALNTALGAVGEPGGVFFTPGQPPVGLSPVNQSTVASLGNAKVLLVDEANPVHGAPKAWKVTEALAKIPYIASFGSFVDDTSAFADLILPDHSFLESWVDSTAESGSLEVSRTVAGPVMKPIHNTRAMVDVLIEVAGKLKQPIELSWKSAEDVARLQPTAANPQSSNQSAIRNPQSAMPSWSEPRFDGDAAAYPFHFLPYVSTAFGDGSSAHLPWLQELPDPMVSAMWSSWIEINSKTAERLNVKQGDLVDVTSSQGTLRVPVFVSPAIAPDVVAMPVGQGHEHFTRYASKRGVNPIAILAPMTESETGALAWAATRVKVVRAADADGSLIMFGAEMRESPHEHEIR